MKSNCSTTLRRTLGVAGFLIGFGLLSAGVASADDDTPGLLGGVTSLVSPVTDAVSPVTDALAPVTRGVAAVADPVLAPLTPVVDSAVQALSPVLEPLQPVTAPVLSPVVRAVQDVPLVPRIAEPLVAQPSAPADVPPAPVSDVPAPAVTPVAVPASHTAALPDRVAAAVAKTPQQHQVSAPDAVPPIEAPGQPLPDVPLALPGTTGSASSNGSSSPVLVDLPARQGVHPHTEVLVVDSNDWIHGAWCYYYGRSHPS